MYKCYFIGTALLGPSHHFPAVTQAAVGSFPLYQASQRLGTVTFYSPLVHATE